MCLFTHHLHFTSEEARLGEIKQLISPDWPVSAHCDTDLLRSPVQCGPAHSKAGDTCEPRAGSYPARRPPPLPPQTNRPAHTLTPPPARAHTHTHSHSHSRSHPHPPSEPAPAALPRPPLSKAEFPPLLIVRGPARPRPAPPPPARCWGKGRVGVGPGAGADRTGVAAAAGPDAAAQIPPATQPPAAPRPPGSEPQPSSAAAAARRHRGSATRESRVTARPPQPPQPPQPPPGLRGRRPGSHRRGSRTLRQPRSHLLRARVQDTMRSALALSALLLLLPPLPSLSQDATGNPTTVKSEPNTKPASSASQVDSTTAKQSPVATSQSPSRDSPSTTVSQQNAATAPSGPTSGKTTAAAGGPSSVPGAAKTLAPTTKPETTSSQKEMEGTAQAETQPPTRETASVGTVAGGTAAGGSPALTQPPVVTAPATTRSSAPSPSAAGTQQGPTPGPVTLNPPGTFPQGPNQLTTLLSSPGTVTVHTAPSPRVLTTPIPASSVTSQGGPQSFSKAPATTGPSSSVPGTSSPGALPPAVSSSSAPVATPPVGPTGSITPLAPTTTPQSSGIPSATPALKNKMIKCESSQELNEKMLILNLTKTGVCADSLLADKLATLFCEAAKANFNPSQDWCLVRLVSVPGVETVAIKEISIHTKLHPSDLYELLKDKWDDLKEVGVSNMQFGDQGPPEVPEDRFSMPLIITIVCMASFLLLVAALYGCCHQRLAQRKDQQRLTEELQTVENGYHDNPTLEVMETSSEMQEKKVVNLNGELGDSWIVPLDNLIKDDLDEEEDTHL
ncbi:podocalyxin [Saccopteryx bilineata]|uniref:podocalyxin n=1 Tax=Saccopteryx bilineata TaxID=59482 RepID=UPI00338EB294